MIEQDDVAPGAAPSRGCAWPELTGVHPDSARRPWTDSLAAKRNAGAGLMAGQSWALRV